MSSAPAAVALGYAFFNSAAFARRRQQQQPQQQQQQQQHRAGTLSPAPRDLARAGTSHHGPVACAWADVVFDWPLVALRGVYLFDFRSNTCMLLVAPRGVTPIRNISGACMLLVAPRDVTPIRNISDACPPGRGGPRGCVIEEQRSLKYKS